MAEIVIPSVGVAMEEALIVSWLKQPGEAVAVEEAIAEIETDKATMDIVSPVQGTLGAHLVEAGTVVPVGAVIVHVLDAAEAGTPASEPEMPADDRAAPSDAAPPEEGTAAQPTPVGVAPAPAVTAPAGRPPHRMSPRARRLAGNQGGTLAIDQTESASPASQPDRGGRFRALIASKVSESWREIPHFTVSREVNAEPMQANLEALRAQQIEPTPTFTDLLLRALAVALADEDGVVDVGLAVATPHGVITPVIRYVLGQQPAALARSRAEAIERARAGRLSREDLDATPRSTLSNLGPFGVDRFTGIVALGQTSLVTVGRALPRVRAAEGGEIRVQTMFDATLNADHRSIDGAEAARLLVAFARAAEQTTPDS